MAVSAMIIRRPGPAKAIFAEVVPRKNFPINWPDGLKTLKKERRQKMSRTLRTETNSSHLNTVARSGIDASFRINLNAIRYTIIDEAEDTTVRECLRNRINVEGVSIEQN